MIANFDADRALRLARHTLQIEADAVSALAGRLTPAFTKAVELILACTGRVVVSGIGKSGHIGRKVAATLASTGTPSFFVHPAEASHGDLGMITRDDVLIAFSNSGETAELLSIIPIVKRIGAGLISITGNPASNLAKLSDAHLDGAVAQEACPLNLAPTASTTAALALGDALAVAVLDARGFGEEDFARSHPGGALGRKLLTHVRDVMRSGNAVPEVRESTPLAQALMEITRKGMAMTAVVDPDGRAVGVFTDGDLRRHLAEGDGVLDQTLAKVMTRKPICLREDALAADAIHIFNGRNIDDLIVVNTKREPVGLVDSQDLPKLKAI